MKAAEYAEMYRLEKVYWWFVARRKLCASMLRRHLHLAPRHPPRILDVGCGTGGMLEEIQSLGEPTGIDSSELAVLYCHRRGLEDVRQGDIGRRTVFPDDSFHVIVALDVLEHIDEDREALEEIYRIAAPGALLFITVPAYGFLWSEHDEALHHRRRYTASELRNKLNVTGFKIQKITYALAFLFFPIFFFRLWQSITKKSISPSTGLVLLPSWLNTLLIRLQDVESLLLRLINFPFGVSIFCIARKP